MHIIFGIITLAREPWPQPPASVVTLKKHVIPNQLVIEPASNVGNCDVDMLVLLSRIMELL